MNSLFALTIIFVIYAVGDIVSTKTHAIVSILVGKIFHESWYLCCAMSITALFGFPGTVIVPTEVTKAVDGGREEAHSEQHHAQDDHLRHGFRVRCFRCRRGHHVRVGITFSSLISFLSNSSISQRAGKRLPSRKPLSA